jgi:hypothetical protein
VSDRGILQAKESASSKRKSPEIKRLFLLSSLARTSVTFTGKRDKAFSEERRKGL